MSTTSTHFSKKPWPAGATERKPVMDQFDGDRSGQLEDPFGHLWWVATHKEDVLAGGDAEARGGDVRGEEGNVAWCRFGGSVAKCCSGGHAGQVALVCVERSRQAAHGFGRRAALVSGLAPRCFCWLMGLRSIPASGPWAAANDLPPTEAVAPACRREGPCHQVRALRQHRHPGRCRRWHARLPWGLAGRGSTETPRASSGLHGARAHRGRDRPPPPTRRRSVAQCAPWKRPSGSPPRRVRAHLRGRSSPKCVPNENLPQNRVKRCRIVKDRIRLWKAGVCDSSDGHLLVPCTTSGALEPLAADGLIEINSFVCPGELESSTNAQNWG